MGRQFKVNYRQAGTAEELDKRDDLIFLTDSQDIEDILITLGWSSFNFDKPTGVWVQVLDGDYGDIYVTFSARPYSIYCTIYKVEREWVTPSVFDLLRAEVEGAFDPWVVEEFVNLIDVVEGDGGDLDDLTNVVYNSMQDWQLFHQLCVKRGK